MKPKLLWIAVLLPLFIPGKQSVAQNVVYQFQKGLSIPLVGSYGREAVFTDGLFYRYAIDSLSDPEEGAIFSEDQEKRPVKWEVVTADDKNWFQHRNLRGGYLVFDYYSKKKEILILEANGHSEVLVNDAWRGGDPYGYGWAQHPVQINKGMNRFIFRGGRGRLQACLTKPDAEAFISVRDPLLPDLIVNDPTPKLGAIRIINASSKALINCQIQSILGTAARTIELPSIPPLSSRKVPFEVLWSAGLESATILNLKILDQQGKEVFVLQDESLQISALETLAKHKETFVSTIDGSIQYYSVVPPSGGFQDSLALFFSLHGASVEAVGQANAYQAKDWGTLVAPTNRRPYGFDWEDWGRLDAIEVLAIARERYHPDPGRMYLTGHSMGGHGTWQVGVSFPGYWAAIGPSAGWYSFWSYGGKKEADVENPFSRTINQSTLPSNTLGLSRNYLQYGIYILHGDQDDNVPVDQARFMREHLGKYHPDFAYYERPGAGHWWGNECVDWAPMFDFFKIHRQLPDDEIKTLEFVTASPGISASARMISIVQQMTPLEFSSVQYRNKLEEKQLSIQTKNTARLQFDFAGFDRMQPYEVQIDSTKFKIIPGTDPKKSFYFHDGQWQAEKANPVNEKGPHRDGLFKSAFNHKMVFVYGTHGTKQENEWSFNKARFDAETFWYRGNGAVEIVADRDYSQAKFSGRNVILYGHMEMNSAWSLLLPGCPIEVRRQSVKVGDELFSGADIGAYFLYPMKNSEQNSVGVIAGTGISGMRATEQNRYFVSGSGFPDYMIFKTSMLEKGQAGLVEAGFFNNQWQLAK